VQWRFLADRADRAGQTRLLFCGRNRVRGPPAQPSGALALAGSHCKVAGGICEAQRGLGARARLSVYALGEDGHIVRRTWTTKQRLNAPRTC